jgi:16S rRNA (cytidine1402-2'-O)-methyltransferase
MALFVVATPIGNSADFTTRALDVLRTADLVIGEELKVLRQILKAAGVQAPAVDQLNEHSRAADVEHLVRECRDKKVALVSDCGTPGFCDPGAELVAACHREGVGVHAVPGASSLMALLSVCGVRLDRFLFYGFLPAKAEARADAWRELQKETRPCVVMETPYRASRLVDDLASVCADRFCVLGLNLTQENERVLRGLGRELPAKGPFDDVEPVALILPAGMNPVSGREARR